MTHFETLLLNDKENIFHRRVRVEVGRQAWNQVNNLVWRQVDGRVYYQVRDQVADQIRENRQ